MATRQAQGARKAPAKVKASDTEVEYGKITLPRFREPQDADFVPEPEDYIDPHNYRERVAYAWDQGLDVLLLGDTGVGKTALVRAMCADTNRAYRRFPCQEATDTSAMIGKPWLEVDDDGKQQTVFLRGMVYDAVLYGHTLLADEYSQAHPDVRIAFNPLHQVDEGVLIVPENEGEVVPRHKDFLFVATGNPYSYAGTKEWGAQILSRFDVVLWMEHLPEAEETELLSKHVPELADPAQFVRAINNVRATKKEEKVQFAPSYREIRNWAKASLIFGTAAAADLAVVNKADPEDQGPVRDLLKAPFDAVAWGA
jgi:MoxR-like ATPase